MNTGLAARFSWTTVLLFVTLAGCVKYQPKPLDPPHIEKDYRARSLTDLGLLNFLAEDGGDARAWPPAELDLESLTMIAWYFSPELQVARAAVCRSEEAIRLAGERVNPSLSLSGGYDTGPDSPVLFDSLLSFTIETGGKRKYRVLQARKQAELARLQAWEAAWRVRSRVRQALIEHLVADRRLGRLQEREAILYEVVTMLERRLAAGEIGRPAVDTVRQQLSAADSALRDAEGQARQTLAVLSGAAGLPVAALEGRRFRERSLEDLPRSEELPLSEIQESGLLHRVDIRRALLEYAVAEASVRVEIAKQYPDLQIGPGFIFEEGFARYVIAFSSMLPLFHQNQVAIAVAEAERHLSETQFELQQALAIGEMEKAVSAYAAALAELAENELRVESARRNVQAATATLKAGEGDRLGVAWEQVLAVEASRARLDTVLRAQTALGALEDAVQNPLAGGAALSDRLLRITGSLPEGVER